MTDLPKTVQGLKARFRAIDDGRLDAMPALVRAGFAERIANEWRAQGDEVRARRFDAYAYRLRRLGGRGRR